MPARSRAARKCEPKEVAARGVGKSAQSRSEGKILPSDLLFIVRSPRGAAHATSTNPLRGLVQVSCTCSHLKAPRYCGTTSGNPGAWPAARGPSAGRERRAQARDAPMPPAQGILRILCKICGWSSNPRAKFAVGPAPAAAAGPPTATRSAGACITPGQNSEPESVGAGRPAGRARTVDQPQILHPTLGFLCAAFAIPRPPLWKLVASGKNAASCISRGRNSRKNPLLWQNRAKSHRPKRPGTDRASNQQGNPRSQLGVPQAEGLVACPAM